MSRWNRKKLFFNEWNDLRKYVMVPSAGYRRLKPQPESLAAEGIRMYKAENSEVKLSNSQGALSIKLGKA